jgi:hypothetical protein
MTLFPDPPPPLLVPTRLEPEQTAADGPLGGPCYSYRGAVIDCQKGSNVCTLRMSDHPLDGQGFGCVGTITPLIDLWLDERRLA